MRVSTYLRQFHAEHDSINADQSVSAMLVTACGFESVLCSCSADDQQFHSQLHSSRPHLSVPSSCSMVHAGLHLCISTRYNE